jgi:hypothetical protein
MKNFFKFLGIISLVLVIGFSMAACKDDDGGDDNGGNNGGQTGGGGGGVLTIQNIPNDITGYVSGYAMWSGQPALILAASDTLTSSTANNPKRAAIGGGKVTLNAFGQTGSGANVQYSKFTGAASYPATGISITLYASAEEGITGSTPVYKSNKVIAFTNGSATLNWDDLAKGN